MLVHLAATDIGLGSCLVGTCAILHPVTDDPSALVDLGAVAIGIASARRRCDGARWHVRVSTARALL